jgi:hypothetical protein
MRSPFLGLIFLLAACGDGFVARDTRVTFEPDTSNFWSLPMPSDLRRQADGTFNLERYPGKRSDLLNMWIKSADARLLDGWGVTTGIFFTTSAKVDAATFPTAAASLEPTASVYLVDIDTASPDYGKALPVNVSFTAEEGPSSPANLLEIIPVYGFVRRPLTTYAVVVTDAVKDSAGKPLGRSLSFHKALENQSDADAKAAASFEPLRVWLAKNNRDRSKVVAATVFKTIDPSATLVKLANWVEKEPAPVVDAPWKLEDNFQSYQWVSGLYTVPQVQAGVRPGEGRIQWEADGQPKRVGGQQMRLALTIPKSPMPPGGFPLMIYFHGSGGEWRESIDRGPRPQIKEYREMDPPLGSGPAEFLARRGIAALGFDFPLHGGRKTPPDTSGLELYNLFGNIDVTLDNMQVGAMEVVYLTRLIPKIEVPVALSANFNPGAATDGMIRFDPKRLSAMGHSMGSTFGIPIATVDPRIQGYVFSGAGGSLVEIANSAHEPVDLKPFIELLLGFPEGQEIRRSHPLLHIFQNLWDFADPAAKARYVAKEPREGHPPRPFFMTAGIRDGYFHPNAETATAVALGATAAGSDVDPTIPAALALDGRTTVGFPLANNLNGVTGGVVQYAAPFELGHYVAFDAADTQQQYTCFLLGVGTAAGPKISAPSGSDTTCP